MDEIERKTVNTRTALQAAFRGAQSEYQRKARAEHDYERAQDVLTDLLEKLVTENEELRREIARMKEGASSYPKKRECHEIAS